MNSKILIQILLLHIRQLCRVLKDWGFIRISMLCFFTFGTILLPAYTPNGEISNIIPILLIIFCINFYRKDNSFMRIISTNSCFLIFLEYCVITIPFVVVLLLHQNFFTILVFEVGLLSISYISYKTLFRNKFVINITIPISPLNYEWVAGIKPTFLVFCTLNALTICSFYFIQMPYFIYGYFLLIYILISRFYIEFEPWHFLFNRGVNSVRSFFTTTIILHFKSFGLLVMPVLVAYLFFFHTEIHFLIATGLIVSSILYILSLIFMKYTLYVPNRKIPVSNISNILWGIVCLVPFSMPVSLFLIFNRYQKATINLHKYFI